jgi:hypothetical protein
MDKGLPLGPIGDALELAAGAWIAANPQLAQELAVEYSSTGNLFLHDAEAAYFRAERGADRDPTVDPHLVFAATGWVAKDPRDPSEPYSTVGNRFLWAAEAAFFKLLRDVELTREPKGSPASPSAVRSKATIPNGLRWIVWERDDFRCLHCGLRRDLTVDHVYPEALGGVTSLENLQTLCRSCNSRKGTRVEDN